MASHSHKSLRAASSPPGAIRTKAISSSHSGWLAAGNPSWIDWAVLTQDGYPRWWRILACSWSEKPMPRIYHAPGLEPLDLLIGRRLALALVRRGLGPLDLAPLGRLGFGGVFLLD